MPVDLASVVAEAHGIARAEGVAGALVLLRPVFNDTGALDGYSHTQTVPDAVGIDRTTLRPDASAEWFAARYVVQIPAAGLAWTPALGDLGVWGGEEARIAAIEPLVPAGAVIGYRLALGG